MADQDLHHERVMTWTGGPAVVHNVQWSSLKLNDGPTAGPHFLLPVCRPRTRIPQSVFTHAILA
jgi:hypothetical protein